MPLARLSIDLPEGTWINDVSTAFPEATFRVLAAIPDGDVGFALVEITASDPESVLQEMAENPQLLRIEPLQQSDEQVVVRLETRAPLLLFSAQASGLPIEPPVVIRNGDATLEQRAPRARLSELGDALEQFGLSYTVEAIYENPDTDDLLSNRQREVLLTAVECGYYDTPRECSLTELAEDIGIAKSTCSEILHRAEGLVIKRFVEETLTPQRESRRTERVRQ